MLFLDGDFHKMIYDLMDANHMYMPQHRNQRHE
jgi:hypothetical protein